MLIAGRAENLKALASGAWQLRVSSRCRRPSSIDEDHSGGDKDRRQGFLDKIACRQILLAKPEATIDRIAPNRNTNSEVGRVTIAPNETAPTTTHTERLEERGDNRGFLGLERLQIQIGPTQGPPAVEDAGGSGHEVARRSEFLLMPH